MIEDLHAALSRPPLLLTTTKLWDAYARVQESRVRGVDARRQLTDLVALVRFALGLDDLLQPFADAVDRKFADWVPASDKVHSIVDDGTWTRLQASNRMMNAAQITELSYRRGVRSAESEPVDVDFELLETETWRLYLRGRGLAPTGIADQLYRVGLATKVGGELRPRRAAVLLFADHPSGLLAATVTLRNEELPPVWEQVSDWIDRNGPIANSDLCEIAELDTLKASKLLKRWVEQGLLEGDASRGKRYIVYSKPTAEGRTQPVLLSTGLDNESGQTDK